MRQEFRRSQRAQAIKRDMILARAEANKDAFLKAALANEKATRESTAEGTASAFIAHESVADALLDLGRGDDALKAYEEVVRDHPGRAHSILGAARAAKIAGNLASRRWYQQLLALWVGAEENTPGLDEARKETSNKFYPPRKQDPDQSPPNQ